MTLQEEGRQQEAPIHSAESDDEDCPLGKARSSSEVEAKLNEMGYKKISETFSTISIEEVPNEVGAHIIESDAYKNQNQVLESNFQVPK